MLIPGHIGFTFGTCYIFSKTVSKKTMTFRALGLIAFIALIPDICDKGLHLLFPRYPDHAVFHSMFLYALIGISFFLVKKWNALSIIGILFLNCLLDLINNPPGSLIYPLTVFTGKAHHYPPVGSKIIERLPQIFSIKDFTGHYLLFEIPGLLLIIYVLIKTKLDNKFIHKSSHSIPTDLVSHL